MTAGWPRFARRRRRTMGRLTDWRTDGVAVRKDASAVTSSFIRRRRRHLSADAAAAAAQRWRAAYNSDLIEDRLLRATLTDVLARRRNYRPTTRYYRTTAKPLPVSSLPIETTQATVAGFRCSITVRHKTSSLLSVFWWDAGVKTPIKVNTNSASLCTSVLADSKAADSLEGYVIHRFEQIELRKTWNCWNVVNRSHLLPFTWKYEMMEASFQYSASQRMSELWHNFIVWLTWRGRKS